MESGESPHCFLKRKGGRPHCFSHCFFSGNGIPQHWRKAHGISVAVSDRRLQVYLAGDNSGALYLSDDEDPAHKKAIAAFSGFTFARIWIGHGKATERISPPVRLEAGRKYYFEMLTKNLEDQGYSGVAWQMPGSPPLKDGDPPISGAYFATPVLEQ